MGGKEWERRLDEGRKEGKEDLMKEWEGRFDKGRKEGKEGMGGKVR